MARMAKGYKSTLMVDIEDAYGEVNATKAGMLLPFNSWNVKPSRSLSQPGTMTGTRNPVSPIADTKQVAGTAVVPLDALSLPWWLRLAFGAPATTGTGPYTHVFKVSDDQPSFFAQTLMNTASPLYAWHKGLIISKMSLSAEPSGEQVVTFDIVGSDVVYDQTDTYDATPAALQFSRLERKDVTFKEGGTEMVKKATKFDFNVDFGLDTDAYTLGWGGVLGDFSEGIMSCAGSLATLLKDNAILLKSQNGTKTSYEIIFANGANSIGFKFPEAKFDLNGPVIEGPKGIRFDANWSAYHESDAGNSAVIITVVNTIPSYA